MKTEWIHKKLGDCCERICNGLTYDVEETQGYFVTRIETISDGYIDYNKIGHINDKPNQDYLMVNGDILFSHINSVKHIGKVAYYDDSTELYHGMNLLLLRANNNIDKLFLFYLLSSDKYRRKIRTLAKSAVNQASISTTDLGKFEISYPESLAAQRRIAAILASADKVIAATQKTIAKYKQIKQGMMEDLLKPKEGWKMVKLGECCEDIFSGKNTTRQDFGKYVVYGSTGPIGYSEDYEYDFDAVLVARVGANAGLVNKVSGLYDVSDNTLIIKILRNVDLNYMHYLLIRLNLNQFIFGSGQPLVTAGLLKKIEIPIPYKNNIPDLTEQRRIAAILSGIDAKIAAEEKVLQKYEKVKKGLMEKLLNEQCKRKETKKTEI